MYPFSQGLPGSMNSVSARHPREPLPDDLRDELGAIVRPDVIRPEPQARTVVEPQPAPPGLPAVAPPAPPGARRGATRLGVHPPAPGADDCDNQGGGAGAAAALAAAGRTGAGPVGRPGDVAGDGRDDRGGGRGLGVTPSHRSTNRRSAAAVAAVCPVGAAGGRIGDGWRREQRSDGQAACGPAARGSTIRGIQAGWAGVVGAIGRLEFLSAQDVLDLHRPASLTPKDT